MLIISCFREFYTGWLTHWGEKIAQTGAEFTASALETILGRNGSAVLYVRSKIFFVIIKVIPNCNALIWLLDF